MTSSTPKSGRPRRRNASPSACETGRPTPRALRGAFTLIEIVLAVALVALLAGMALVNFGAWRSGQALDEGAQRWETALRMARAEAANLGRRLRLAFDANDGRVVVLWEPEPLTEPGQFTEYTACGWKDAVDLGGVRVEKCEYIGSSTYRTLDAQSVRTGDVANADLAEITFEPDGSSDSVALTLVAADAPESPRVVIEIDGLSGAISSRRVSLEESPAP